MPYSSSLSDAEWEVIEPLLREILPQKKPTRPHNWSQRAIIDAILYQLKNGCDWNDLPRDFPPYKSGVQALQAMAADLDLYQILQAEHLGT